jgi:cytochrome c peroxidase
MNASLKKLAIVAVLLAMTLTLVFAGAGMADPVLTDVEQLGSFLYFDENLSEPAGQSCASCHDPDFGFVDPDADLPVSEGVNLGRFGDRNSPASAYAMYAPSYHTEMEDGEILYVGGQFWDGRATGAVLGDPLADQALGPFLNPVEMANPDEATVVLDAMSNSVYGELFTELCWDDTADDPIDAAYDCIALSIAAFERTEMFGQFSSKYDYYLQACLAGGGAPDDCAMGIGKEAKKASKIFTREEWYGLQLFMGENNNDGILDKGEGAMCAACHVANFTEDPGNVVVPDWSPEGWVPPVFTDFTYDNLGVPKNWDNPFLYQDLEFNPAGLDYIDYGLGNREDGADGLFKVMTLRNIGLTAPYAHNGFFTRLKDITHFYNTRDVPGALPKGADWPPPEIPDTVNFDELGNLGLSDADEDALVEFMKTLSDGWTP